MKRNATILVLALLVPSAFGAQQSLLPLASVVRKVVQRDPGILARQAEVEAARSDARRAETQRLPKLYLSTDTGAGKNVNDIANVLLTGLSGATVANPATRSRLGDLSGTRPYFVPGARLEDDLYDGGRTGAAVRAARLTADKDEIGKQQSSEDEAYTTASYYLNLARGQILDKDLADYAGIAQLAAKALSDQAQAGRITQAQALAGQAKAEEARAALENNRDDLRLWSDLLRRLAALPSTAAFDTSPLETYLQKFEPAAVPGEEDAGSNPDLKEAMLDTRIQEQQMQEAKSQRLPQVKFVAEYGFQFSNLLFTFRPGYNVGVEVSYPLFTSGETARDIAAARQRLQAAAFKERKTREALEGEFEQFQEENRKIGRELDAARSALDQAGDVYRVARLKYDQGAGSAPELLEAAELLLNSRERCLDLTRSSLLLQWSALRLENGLETELEKGTLP